MLVRNPGDATSSQTVLDWHGRTILMLGICLAFLSFPALAGKDESDLCDRAARLAASETGIPQAVMLAIARTETGRSSDGQLAPWPWTVNMEGKGVWFPSKQQAQDFAKSRYDQGARSFDIGCFQVNHRWHGQHFDSISDMFDPITNARYAAGFLSRLYSEMGSWSKAAAAYHSRTPEYANKYKTRFNRILASLEGGAKIAVSQSAFPQIGRPSREPQTNGFPLLIKRPAVTAPGSLVPLAKNGARPFLSHGG